MKMKAPAGSGATGDINIAMKVETELYDINTPITIAPPTDVFVPPTPPAGAAARPTQTRTSAQPTTPRPIASATRQPTATVAAAADGDCDVATDGNAGRQSLDLGVRPSA